MKTIFCYKCDGDKVHMAACLDFQRNSIAKKHHWDRGGPVWVCSECGEVIRSLPSEQTVWLDSWFRDPPGVTDDGTLQDRIPSMRELPEKHKTTEGDEP